MCRSPAALEIQVIPVLSGRGCRCGISPERMWQHVRHYLPSLRCTSDTPPQRWASLRKVLLLRLTPAHQPHASAPPVDARSAQCSSHRCDWNWDGPLGATRHPYQNTESRTCTGDRHVSVSPNTVETNWLKMSALVLNSFSCTSGFIWCSSWF